MFQMCLKITMIAVESMANAMAIFTGYPGYQGIPSCHSLYTHSGLTGSKYAR